MKLLAKNNIKALACPFMGHTEVLIQIRIGPFMFLATPAEAIDLATQLVAAVDDAKTADSGADSEVGDGQ